MIKVAELLAGCLWVRCRNITQFLCCLECGECFLWWISQLSSLNWLPRCLSCCMWLFIGITEEKHVGKHHSLCKGLLLWVILEDRLHMVYSQRWWSSSRRFRKSFSLLLALTLFLLPYWRFILTSMTGDELLGLTQTGHRIWFSRFGDWDLFATRRIAKVSWPLIRRLGN